MKKDPEAKERFDKAEGEEVPEDYFEKALYVKHTNQQAIDLENHGFDVEGLLGYVIQDDSNEGNNEESKPQEDGEVDPEKVF